MKKLLMTLLLCSAAQAAPAQDARFTVVTIDTAKQKLELFLNDETGQPFNGFARLNQWLGKRGKRLAFAVNAGMYHADFAPVGLFVNDGRQLAPLNLGAGAGNFFLKPNGVFLITTAGRPKVVDSDDYAALGQGVRLATQSGPLLLRHGAIHPAFSADSQSRHVRNGVCALGSKAIFVISNHAVTFHEFAVYFRDNLHCSDALYFDGTVSSLYSPALGRNDAPARLGPILGVVE